MAWPAASFAQDSVERSARAESELQRLMADLKSEDPEARLSAIRLLGQYREGRAEAGLMERLRVDTPDQRLAAALALGRIRSRGFLDEFDAEGQDTPTPRLRQTMVLALAEYPDADAMPRWINALRDEAVGVREAAFAQLQSRSGLRLGYRPGDSDILRRRGVERWAAWWREAKDKPRAAWWQGLADLDNNEICTVCAKITRENAIKAIPTLVDWLRHDSPAVRAAAQSSLRAMTLRDFGFLPDADEIERRPALAAWQLWVKETKYDDPAALLLSGLEDDAPVNRRSAIERMAATGDAKFTPVLVGSLMDAGEEVRRAASDALFALAGRRFGFDAAAPEADRAACVAAWRAWLRDSIDKPRTEIIIGALSGGEDEVRERALQDLNACDPYLAVDNAIERLLDPAWRVRRRAIEILRGRFGMDFDYRAELPDEAGERRDAIRAMTEAKRAWERWWRLNRDRHTFK